MNKTVEIHNAVLTKRAKLLRLAEIVRGRKVGWFNGNGFVLFSNIEHLPDANLATLTHPDSVFYAAHADPVLRDAGLSGETVLDAKKFFELSTDDLHKFSCDCGGQISNADMADRIDALAAAA